jgi:hypothetical protein
MPKVLKKLKDQTASLLFSSKQNSLSYFKLNALENCDAISENIKDTFYWKEIPGVISNSFYNLLCEEYPEISLFDKHVGIPRAGLQRPHDRYYLALNWGPYSRKRRFFSQRGVIKKRGLTRSWQSFINLLESDSYVRFVSDILKTNNFKIRFAWHMGFTGAEISPHVDAPPKLGTHIFYFNREGEWDPKWGGQTVLLSGLKKECENPEFADFSHSWEANNIGNTSLIWKNSPLAWHGVRPLAAPEGSFRKIFTVVFDSV